MKINNINNEEFKKKVKDFIDYYNSPINDNDGDEEIKIKQTFQILKDWEKILITLRSFGLSYEDIKNIIQFQGCMNTVRLNILNIYQKINNELKNIDEE